MINELKIIENSDNQLLLNIEELKAFLKLEYEVDNNNEDFVVLRSFRTAIEQCEKIIGKSILRKTYCYNVYHLPKNNFINLFYGDVETINRIYLITKQNSTIEIDTTKYFLQGDRVIFNSLQLQMANFLCLSIEYEAKLQFIPEDILQAILFHTTKIYEDKTGYTQIPKASLNIYKKYKNINL